MKTLLLFLLTLSLVAIYGGCGHGERSGEDQVKTDAQLSEDVERSLQSDAALGAADIDVKTSDGVVTLDGKVIGQAEAEKALQIARSVPGVKRVESNLTVDQNITNADVKDRVEEAEETARDRNEQEKGKSEGNVFDDATLTARVKMKLAQDEQVSALKIDVDTKNQIVTLTGNVDSEAAAKQAIRIAGSVEGVKDVRSVLQVEPEDN